MTPDEARAAANDLHTLHQRFAPLFGYAPAQDHALTYLRGLLLHEGRKNVETIALVFGESRVRPSKSSSPPRPGSIARSNRRSRPSSLKTLSRPPAPGVSAPASWLSEESSGSPFDEDAG